MAVLTTEVKQGGANVLGTGKANPVTLIHEIDIAKAITAGLLTTEEAYLWTVPAETEVKIQSVENVNLLTLVTRIDVGDSGSATQWVSNASTLTAGVNHSIATERETYNAADRVGITLAFSGSTATGIIRIVGVFTDNNRNAAATDKTYTHGGVATT